MKITRIRIKNFQQFKDFDLDLTYPMDYHDATKRGKPLDKVCFIGKNGTGKTTLLELVKNIIQNNFIDSYSERLKYSKKLCIILDLYDEKDIYPKKVYLTVSSKSSNQNIYIDDILTKEIILVNRNGYEDNFEKLDIETIISKSSHYINYDFHFDSRKSHLVYIPAEFNKNESAFLDWNFSANRNDGAELFNGIDFYHEISFENLKKMWALVTFQYLKRDFDKNDFENKNLSKTKKELIDEFNKLYPISILDNLKIFWDKILNHAGLELDVNIFKTPAVLTDSLHYHIKNEKGEHIPIHLLSYGMRLYLFITGYLSSLYFNREIESSIILHDEPENSLFVDFQREIIDIYTNPSNFPNSQFFFATHSPIIASQFDPAERIILDFDDEYFVTHRRGSAPEGDDANDLLKRDFEISNTMTDKGVEKWNEYLSLKDKARSELDAFKKQELIDKAFQIAQEYRFVL